MADDVDGDCWNDAQEALVSAIQIRAVELTAIYEQRAIRAVRWGNWLSFTAALISCSTAVESIVSNRVPELLIIITTSVGGFIAALLIALNNIWACGVVQCESRGASEGFFRLSNKIKNQLAINREDRQGGEDFLQEISNELEHLKALSPI